jgi:glycosyltransferase involved in cell wall biosynthesis
LQIQARKPTVLTVHDLRFYDESRWIKKLVFWLMWVVLPCMAARAVTVVSEETRRRLVGVRGVNPQKVHVIPNYVNPAFQHAQEAGHASGDPDVLATVLHIGTTSNKNLDRVAKACASLGYLLIVVGVLDERQRGCLREMGVKVENYQGVSEEELIRLYRRSSVVSFPSLAEGFGLPIIEAQSLGVPVLTSNREPMRTVSGRGALLVDPECTEDIRRGLRVLVEDKSLRKEFVSLGRQNSTKYRLDKVVSQYVEVYRSVLEDLA